MAESENDCLNVLCSFCKKPAVNKKVKCINCSSIFHNSCYNKKTKKCCEKQYCVEEKPTDSNEEINTMEDSMGKLILHEIKLLKETNQSLNDNIKLLQGKIENLEIENVKLRREITKNNVNELVTHDEKCINSIIGMVKENIESSWKSIIGKLNDLDMKINTLSKDRSGKNCSTKQKAYQEKKQTATRNVSKQLNTGSPKQIYKTSLENQQRLMNEIINLDINQVNSEETICNMQLESYKTNVEGQQRTVLMDETVDANMNEVVNKIPRNGVQNNDNSDTENWQLQKERRRNKRNIGQSEEKNMKFKGATPRVWMYIYKVSQEVTEEDIKEFLQKKVGDKKEDFIVKDLKELGRTKSFMVAADFKYKDELYRSSLWPQGVNYRRFDFNKYYEKHNTRNIIFNENEGRPNSFLEVIN